MVNSWHFFHIWSVYFVHNFHHPTCKVAKNLSKCKHNLARLPYCLVVLHPNWKTKFLLCYLHKQILELEEMKKKNHCQIIIKNVFKHSLTCPLCQCHWFQSKHCQMILKVDLQLCCWFLHLLVQTIDHQVDHIQFQHWHRILS